MMQRAYHQIGSVEGYITKVDLDGRNGPIIWLRSRIDGQSVKCVIKGKAHDVITHYEAGEGLRGLRVQLFGMIHYKGLKTMKICLVSKIL